MNTIFLNILNMSFCAGWLILAIVFLRLLFRNIPKWGCVLLWGLVALRLLVPFSVESRFSLIPATMANVELPFSENLEAGIPSPPPTINTDIVADAATRNIDLLSVSSIMWCVGVLFLAVYFVYGYCRLTHMLDTAVLLRDNVYQCEGIHSSIVFGIIHPKICIPFRVDESNMNHIIAHEKAHIRRGDHWWKLIGYFVLMLHWFNPLVWISYILLGRDIEIACDEAVIRNLSQEDRADYAQTLVTIGTRGRIPNVYPLYFGEIGVKARVKAMMRYRQSTFWHHVLLFMCCVLLVGCFLTNPAKAVEEIVIDTIVQETQPPQAENPTRPSKDLTGIDLGDAPVRDQIAFMEEELELLKLKLKEVQAQYEETELRFRIPLKDLMDHYEERIQELETHIQSAKEQIGME